MKKVVLSAVACIMAFSTNASSDFDNLYVGAGAGVKFLKSDYSDFKDYNDSYPLGDGEITVTGPSSLHGGTVKSDSYVGSFVMGGGKVVSNNVYVGTEFLADFTKNKKVGDFNTNYEMRGFVPQVNIKLGYVANENILAYGKVGCALSKASQERHIRTKLNEETPKLRTDHGSKNKMSFVLGIGAEKVFHNKISAALEADYNFGFKWKEENHEIVIHRDDESYIYEPTSWNLKCNKGWTVRALVKHNVKY